MALQAGLVVAAVARRKPGLTALASVRPRLMQKVADVSRDWSVGFLYIFPFNKSRNLFNLLIYIF